MVTLIRVEDLNWISNQNFCSILPGSIVSRAQLRCFLTCEPQIAPGDSNVGFTPYKSEGTMGREANKYFRSNSTGSGIPRTWLTAAIVLRILPSKSVELSIFVNGGAWSKPSEFCHPQRLLARHLRDGLG